MIKLLLIAGIAIVLPAEVVAAGPHGTDHHYSSTGDTHHRGMHGTESQSSAVGEPADPVSVDKTIRVDMLDPMRFVFDQPLELKSGDVVHFVVSNRGALRHEFSIGNEREQKAHRAMMRDRPEMVHADASTVTVGPGKAKEMIWRFEGQGPVVFACNIPGHAEAGMVATAMLKP
ncbi:MAG: copper-binding protein [Pseudomonadota bacterium]